MKTGQSNSSSTLFDLSKTFAENVVIPIPKRKKKAPYRSGQIFVSFLLWEKDWQIDK